MLENELFAISGGKLVAADLSTAPAAIIKANERDKTCDRDISLITRHVFIGCHGRVPRVICFDNGSRGCQNVNSYMLSSGNRE